jgi:hypothetical protein
VASTTERLGIPLLLGTYIVNKDRINDALKMIDANALPNSHADSGVHWAGWKANQNHQLKDIIRLPDMPSWGYLECTKAGKSGTAIPAAPYAPGDKVVDGGVEWTARTIGSTGDWCTKKQAIAYAISLG